MNIYRVNGIFIDGVGKFRTRNKFTKELLAENRECAIEKIYSEIGSKHRVKRRDIKIDKIVEIRAEEVSSKFVKQLLILEKGK